MDALCKDLNMLYIVDSNIYSSTIQRWTHFHDNT